MKKLIALATTLTLFNVTACVAAEPKPEATTEQAQSESAQNVISELDAKLVKLSTQLDAANKKVMAAKAFQDYEKQRIALFRKLVGPLPEFKEWQVTNKKIQDVKQAKKLLEDLK